MRKKETFEKELDFACSLIVRIKEQYCYTCEKPLPFISRSAGHYITRRNRSTRWDLMNNHTQCTECNCDKGGKKGIYKEKLKAEYGLDAFDAMIKKGNEPFYDTRNEYYYIISVLLSECVQLKGGEFSSTFIALARKNLLDCKQYLDSREGRKLFSDSVEK